MIRNKKLTKAFKRNFHLAPRVTLHFDFSSTKEEKEKKTAVDSDREFFGHNKEEILRLFSL